MKKFLPLLIIILLLTGAVVWFITNRTHGTFDKEEDAFAISNKRDITKVILADTDNKKVELTKVNGVWVVNGKYPAREELIISLFDVLARIKTLCPVPRAGQDNATRSLFAQHIKVEVYTGKDEAERVYYVGGPTPDAQGTYMLREVDGKPDARPYITYLPGLLGYLTPRYQTDEETWRTRTLFKYEPEEIKSLSVEYPGDESKSFMLDRVAKDSFSLSPLMSEKARINQPYKQKYIFQYLQFYSSISIEAFDNANPAKDSVMHTTPYCVFTITSTANKVNKAKLFYQPVSKRSKMPFDKEGKPMTYDVDHYYAAINDDKDFAIVQYYVFGKLLRSYEDFFFKPGSTTGGK